jgi:hypothetical protein
MNNLPLRSSSQHSIKTTSTTTQSQIPSKMQFLTIASLFAAALAAPTPQTTDCPNPAHCGGPPDPAHYENVDITDWSLRKNNGTIQSVYFKLSGENATDLVCETGVIPSLPAPVVNCGDSDYRYDSFWTINNISLTVQIRYGRAGE